MKEYIEKEIAFERVLFAIFGYCIYSSKAQKRIKHRQKAGRLDGLQRLKINDQILKQCMF